jgi:hypothetical protein
MFHATAIIVKRRNAITEFFAMPRPKGSKGGGKGTRKGPGLPHKGGGRKPRKRRVNPVDERKLEEKSNLEEKGRKNMPRKYGESRSEASKNRPRWTHHTIEAVCQEDGCGEVWDKANAMQMAAVHFDKTGHIVDVLQVSRVRFGSVAGPADAPARVPQVPASPAVIPEVPPSPDWKEPMSDEDLILGAPVPLQPHAPEELDHFLQHTRDVAQIRENLASDDPLPDLFPDEPPYGEDAAKQALSVPAAAPPPFEF